MNKIKDNPSYDKVRQFIESVKAMKKVLKIASFLGFKTKDTKDIVENINQMITIESEIEIIVSKPDRFNYHFSNLGWIAHESMNSDIMDKTIQLADEGKIDDAENLLIDYYCSDETKFHVSGLKNIPAFMKRYQLIN